MEQWGGARAAASLDDSPAAPPHLREIHEELSETQSSQGPDQAAALGGPAATQQPPGEAAAGADGIARRHTSELSYSDFVREYMAPNIPVLIEVRGFAFREREACRGGRKKE